MTNASSADLLRTAAEKLIDHAFLLLGNRSIKHYRQHLGSATMGICCTKTCKMLTVACRMSAVESVRMVGGLSLESNLQPLVFQWGVVRCASLVHQMAAHSCPHWR